jgi:agmatinase
MNSEFFDASGVGLQNGNYFGFPFTTDEADIIIVNVPWDATTSYRRGAAQGPAAMVKASTQLDFYNFDIPGAQIVPVATDRSLEEVITGLNLKAGILSADIITQLEAGLPGDDSSIASSLVQVNQYSAEVEHMVQQCCRGWLSKGKPVIIAGGEHSVPLGYLKALAEIHDSFGILQIDAHADLRSGFEGFEQSHASIMDNALKIINIRKLIQVGIRDISIPEMHRCVTDPRIRAFSDFDLKHYRYAGGNWFEQCRDMIAGLPQKVYLSFDIDGLDPSNCPNTGTPVPGGITPDEAMYLIRMVVESGRQIIGADLCEVAPGTDEWDASVGARLLYRISSLVHFSNHPTTA